MGNVLSLKIGNSATAVQFVRREGNDMITGQAFIFNGAAIAALFKSIFVLWLSIASFWTISVNL